MIFDANEQMVTQIDTNEILALIIFIPDFNIYIIVRGVDIMWPYGGIRIQGKYA